MGSVFVVRCVLEQVSVLSVSLVVGVTGRWPRRGWGQGWLANRRWLFQSSCGMCWWSTVLGGGPHCVLEANHRAVSRCMLELLGVFGIAVVIGIMRSRVISQSAEGKCQAFPSMMFLLRVDGCWSVM